MDSKPPILLVGTKSDLRTKQSAIDGLKANGEEPVTFDEVCFILNLFIFIIIILFVVVFMILIE